jgi:hypothetical protein
VLTKGLNLPNLFSTLFRQGFQTGSDAAWVDPDGRPPGSEPGFEGFEIQGKASWGKGFGMNGLQKSLSAQIQRI